MAASVALGLGACGAACGMGKAPALTGAYDAPVAASSGESDRGPVPSVGERLIARNLTLRITTADPAAALGAARKIAADAGGFVLNAAEDGDKRAWATVRVPADKLEDVRGKFAALGKVAEESVTGSDVTETVRDLRIRLDNARKTRESYVVLLGRATTVEETLKVEKELERVTVEIETMEAQLEELDSSVRYATFELSFARPVKPGPLGWIFYGGYHAVKWLFVWD